MDLNALCKTAIEAAIKAGEYIQSKRNEELQVLQKEGGSSYASQVVTAVDRQAEALIISHLEPSFKHDIALLSEEREDDGGRFLKNCFWCIDPLDGTLSFIKGLAGYSVSIGLVAKDGSPLIGVVYDPSTKNLYHGIKDQGAFKNHLKWLPKQDGLYLSYIGDRPIRDSPKAAELEQQIQAYLNKLGLKECKRFSSAGAVLNAISLIERGPAIMIKPPKKNLGGGSIWDYAATACLFQELGLQASNYYGKRLDLNKLENSFMNHEGVLYANLPYGIRRTRN